MSEEQAEGEIALTEEPAAIEPDPEYTLSQSRLNGSAACLNCGTGLSGPFCYYCGQPDRNFLRFFPRLLREFLEDTLDFDSRFARTMKPLLFKPGRLTRDYLDGRRFRYTPPMRLYLFSSIVFFLLAAFLSTDAIDGTRRDLATARSGGDIVSITTDTEEELARVEEALSRLPPEIRDQIDLEVGEDGVGSVNQEEDFFDDGEIQFNGEPWDRETNPVDIRFLPAWFNDWINDEIAESPEKADRINDNPRLIVDQIFDLLPGTMFILLPFVALILKFWYLFSGRYYIEHLILALHNHAFIFVLLIIALLLEVAEDMFRAQDIIIGVQIAVWVNVAIAVWIPVYLVGALRTVYRQNWFMTLAKGFVIGISYLFLLGIVTSVVALLGFILL